MNKPTIEQIATSYSLWMDYVDPLGTMDVCEFESMTVAERINLINEVFSDELEQA
jgi:hypothetical protein